MPCPKRQLIRASATNHPHYPYFVYYIYPHLGYIHGNNAKWRPEGMWRFQEQLLGRHWATHVLIKYTRRIPSPRAMTNKGNSKGSCRWFRPFTYFGYLTAKMRPSVSSGVSGGVQKHLKVTLWVIFRKGTYFLSQILSPSLSFNCGDYFDDDSLSGESFCKTFQSKLH